MKCPGCGRFARYDAYPRGCWWCENCEREVKVAVEEAPSPFKPWPAVGIASVLSLPIGWHVSITTLSGRTIRKQAVPKREATREADLQISKSDVDHVVVEQCAGGPPGCFNCVALNAEALA